MSKALAQRIILRIIAAQCIQRGYAVLDKAAVGEGVNTQSSQSHNDLRAGLTVDGTPAGETAIILLMRGQPCQAFVHCGLDLGIGLIIGSQSLDGHCGNVHIRSLLIRTSQCPAAVRLDLLAEDSVDEDIAGHFTEGRIVVAVQRNQGENRTIDALLIDIVHTVQALQQVMTAYIGGVFADGSQCKNHPGIVGGLGIVESLVGVHVSLHILHHIVVVPGRYAATAASQGQRQPLAADAAHDRRGLVDLRLQTLTDGGIDVAHLCQQLLALQLRQLGDRRVQCCHLFAVHQLLLLSSQRVIRRLYRLDGSFVLQRYLTDGVDLLLHDKDRVALDLCHLGEHSLGLFFFSHRQAILLLQHPIGSFGCVHSLPVVDGQLLRLRQCCQLHLERIHSRKVLDLLLQADQLLQIRYLALLTFGKNPIRGACGGHIVHAAGIGLILQRSRELGNQVSHVACASVDADNVQGIPRAVAVLLVACLIVHTQPVLRAAAQIDGVACLDGDRLRALEEAAALRAVRDLLIQKRLDLEVLVAGGGRQLDGCRLSVDDQGVIILSTSLAGDKVRGQHRTVHGQSLNGGVGIAPGAAQIGAPTLAGVHDADDIAACQLAALHRERTEALVDKPIVQRAHPAGGLAAVKFLQSIDAGDIVSLCAHHRGFLGFQRIDHTGHHGAVGGQIDPCIHQRAVPVFLTVRPQIAGKGGVLHNDLHLAVVGGGFLHRHHSGLIGTLHRSDRGGGVDALHALVIGGLRLVVQAVIQRLQAGESSRPGGVHVLADRRPGDGHRHVVVGHGELLRRVLKAHIDIVLILAQILCVIVGNHRFGLYSAGINALIGDALNLIGFAANSDSQAAIDGITVAIGGELQVLIADTPFRTVHGKRPLRLTGLEVRRIVDAGDKAHLGRRGSRCHLRAIRDGCRESAERLGLDGGAIASAAAAILGGRMLPQVLGHVVQHGGDFVGVTHHVHRQLERLVLREGLVGIGESLDTVVLGLLHAGQLPALVVAHARIAGDQLVHGGLDTGGKQAGIVGQLVQLRAEVGQVLFILRGGVVLQPSDGFNGRLLGITGIAGGGGSLDSGGAGIIGTLEFAPDSGTEIVFRIGGIRLVQLGLQSIFHGGQVVGRIHMNPNGCAAVCRIVFTCVAGAAAVSAVVDVALFVLPQVIGSDQIPALTVQRHTGTAVCIGDNRFFVLGKLLRGGMVIRGGFRHVTDKQGHVCARLDSTAATQRRLCLLDGQGKRFARLHLQPVALDKLRCLYTVDILPQLCAAAAGGGLELTLRIQI